MRPSRVALAAIVVWGLVLSAGPAVAGTICGTIQDAGTSAPVAHAGVFVRLPDGTNTGFYGATDSTGHFCISGIPAGTYDLEMLLDDYQVAYKRNVVVTETTDAVVSATLSRVMLALPEPNPARDEVRLQWVLSEAAGVRLIVYDVSGRMIQGWSTRLLPAGAHSIRWDLRAADGRAIPAGSYFVVLDVSGTRYVRSFLRVP
jgi:hypothetical protein